MPNKRSLPWTLGTPSFSVSAFKAAIDILTLSVCAVPMFGANAMKNSVSKMNIFLHMCAPALAMPLPQKSGLSYSYYRPE